MDLSSFDWPRWLNSLNWVLREEFNDDFTTTFLPLFKAAPPPPSDNEMILVNAYGCGTEEMRDFLFSVASRNSDQWRRIFEWGTLDVMFALQALERDKFRPPISEILDVPDEVAEVFDRFKTTRDKALVLFYSSADDVFSKDGDKAIRTRVAKFLITNPVKWEYDDWVIELDDKEIWLVEMSGESGNESGDEESSDESEL